MTFLWNGNVKSLIRVILVKLLNMILHICLSRFSQVTSNQFVIQFCISDPLNENCLGTS